MTPLMSTPRILLIEDRESDIDLFQQALQETGHRAEIEVARNRAAARDALDPGVAYRRTGWDLVLLDLNLDGTPGLDLLDEIVGCDPLNATPVLVLSASGSPADVQAALAHGARAYIRKPLTFSEFVDVVDLTMRFWLECAAPVGRVPWP